MSSIYNIDFAIAAERLLPPDKRNPIMIAWLTQLLEPLQEKHDEIFNEYKPELLKRTNYNGQVMVFEALLNKELGCTGIYIETKQVNDSAFKVFGQGNTEGTAIYTQGALAEADDIKDQTAFDGNTDNFIVWVPVAVYSTININKLNALVRKYKLYGTTYSVQTF